MRSLIIFLSILPVVCSAEDFDNRVSAGDAVSGTDAGEKYEATLGPYIGKAMRACIPPGSTDPGNLGKFTYVAWVNESGKVLLPEVKPNNKISNCFATEISSDDLPNPPLSALKKSGYPLTIEMTITP